MSEKYSIGMNVYGGGFTGHTNVTLTSNVNGVVASKTYGGQVDSWSTSLLGTTGVLDGKVVPENEKKLTEPHATFEISLTKEQYDKVFGLAESTLGQQFDYDLYNQNCVTYAQSLYKAAGLLGHFSGNFTFEDYQKTKSLVWSIMKPNAQIKWDLIQSKYILGLGLVDTFGAQVHCFPAGTLISIAGGATREIESLAPGDLVVAFDQKGVLLPGAIARLFRNVTSEWLILSCGLTVTPGHRFLNECGEFERIDQLTARGGKVVLEDGSLQSVTAERIVYSDATRHLYEEAEEAVYQSAGGAALQPEIRRGWRTYNFEVEEYHTYIAGGVRVHNDSLQDYLNLSVMMKNDAYTAVAIDDMVDHFGWGAVGSASWSSEPFTQASFEAHANAMVEAHREAVAMRDFKTANGILEGFDSLASGARAAAQENARAQAENQRSAALPQIQAEGRNIARGAGVIDQARKAMGGVVVPDGGTAVGSGDGYSNHTPDINGPPEHDDPNDGDGVPGTAPPGGGENLSAGNRPDESSDADAENANPVTYTAGPATITRHADGTVYSEVNSGKKRSFATVRDKDVLALGEANVLGDGRTEENTKTALIGGGMQETTTIYSRAGGMLSQTVKARKILRQKFETHDNGTKTLDEYSRSGLLEHQILIEKNGSGWFWEINLKPKAGEFRTKKTFFNKKGVSTYALLTFKNGPSEIESYQKSFELSPKIQLLTLIGEARNGMGNALANLIKGNDQKNVLQGLAGNDTLRGMDGNDSLNGGLGDDRLEGGEGHDILEGEDGADVLLGGEGDDRLNGGAGSDDLAGDDGDDTLEGGAGDDTLAGGKGDDVLRGDAGADNLEGGAGADFLDGGEGADVLRGGAGNDRLWGGAGNDVLSGEDGNDGLNGADGDDRLEGGLGDDQLLGGDGNDILAGDGGDDLLVGGAGQDSLSGGDGHDELEGMEGDDSLSGNAGSDTLRGGAGADTLNGGDGTDVMAGGDGADSLNGGIGDDQLSGGAGNDTLDGGEGHDQLLGGAGNDRLIGGPGVDFLDGGDGEDTIVLSGVRSDYLIRYNAAIGRYSILDLRTGSPDGTDLAGIELFQFSDGLMSASVLNYIVGTDAATAWNVDNADGSQTTIAWTVSPSDPVKWDATITHYNHGGANKEKMSETIFRHDGSRISYAKDVGGPNEAGTELWTSYVQVYDTQARLVSQTYENDDGTQTVAEWDWAGAQPWWKRETTRDAADQTVKIEEWTEVGQDIYLSLRHEYDYTSVTWAEKIQKFDAAMNIVWDEVLYDGGARTILERDYFKLKDWERWQHDTDAAGHLIYQKFTYYSEQWTKYKCASSEYFADFAGEAWNTKVYLRDGFGRIVNETIRNDAADAKGHKVFVTHFDYAANAKWWKLDTRYETVNGVDRKLLQYEYKDENNLLLRNVRSWDYGNGEDWSYRNRMFNAQGEEHARNFYKDNGTLVTFDWDVAGSSPDGTESWDQIEQHFTKVKNGERTYKKVTYDDDRVSEQFFDVANTNSAWQTHYVEKNAAGTRLKEWIIDDYGVFHDLLNSPVPHTEPTPIPPDDYPDEYPGPGDANGSNNPFHAKEPPLKLVRFALAAAGLKGTSGDDTFVFERAWSGNRSVTEFEGGQHSGDVIVFDRDVFKSARAVFAAAKQVGDDVVIAVGREGTLVLRDVMLASLQADDFRFAA